MKYPSKFNITVFSQRNCQPCRRTKAVLEKEKIPFKEVYIEDNPEAADYVKFYLGARSTPVVVVTERMDHWSGLDEARLRNLVVRYRADVSPNESN